VVALWTLENDINKVRERLQRVGVDAVITRVAEAEQALKARLESRDGDLGRPTRKSAG